MSKDKPSTAAIKPPLKGQLRVRKQPKRITPEYLHNSGLYYLQRFAASSGQFRAVMIRKARRSCHTHKDQDFEACRQMIEELVAKFVRAGLLDDDSFLKGCIASFRRRGLSRQSILFRLKAKGFTDSVILDALEMFDIDSNLEDHDPEMIAALRYARKKRLGPFSKSSKDELEKQLSSLARQGFSYETSRSVLMMDKLAAEELMGLA